MERRASSQLNIDKASNIWKSRAEQNLYLQVRVPDSGPEGARSVRIWETEVPGIAGGAGGSLIETGVRLVSDFVAA